MDKRWIGGAGALLIVLAAVAWWLGWFGTGEDPLIAQTRELAETPQAEQTEEQRTEMGEAWRERFRGLNEEQRGALFEQMAPIFVPLMMRQFEARVDAFMAMTPEQQRAELDKEIDKMLQRRAANGGNPGGPGGGGGGGGPGGGRSQMDPRRMAGFQKKMLAYTTPEQRSKFQAGMLMYTNRMRERGLDPPPMQGGGFF